MAFWDNLLPYFQLPPTIYTITLYTRGHLEISWEVFAKKSADIPRFHNSFITISICILLFGTTTKKIKKLKAAS